MKTAVDCLKTLAQYGACSVRTFQFGLEKTVAAGVGLRIGLGNQARRSPFCGKVAKKPVINLVVVVIVRVDL